MPKLTGEAAAARKRAAKAVARPTPAVSSGQVTEELWTDDFASLDTADSFLNQLWYGPEGSAKTTNLCSAANHGKVLVINVEGGAKRQALVKRGINVANIQFWPDPTRGQKLTFDGLVRVYNRLRTDLTADPSSWFAVGMDSYTEIHDSALEEAGATRLARLKAANRVSEMDYWDTDRADYGRMGKQLRHVLRRFRDLPCHFLVTALENRTVDESTGSVAYGPLASNKAAIDILGYVDFVLACKRKTGSQPFRALTKEGGQYRAKDRFDVLPAVMAEPTFDRVWAYYRGQLTTATDPLQKGVRQPGETRTKEATK